VSGQSLPREGHRPRVLPSLPVPFKSAFPPNRKFAPNGQVSVVWSFLMSPMCVALSLPTIYGDRPSFFLFALMASHQTHCVAFQESSPLVASPNDQTRLFVNFLPCDFLLHLFRAQLVEEGPNPDFFYVALYLKPGNSFVQLLSRTF